MLAASTHWRHMQVKWRSEWILPHFFCRINWSLCSLSSPSWRIQESSHRITWPRAWPSLPQSRFRLHQSPACSTTQQFLHTELFETSAYSAYWNYWQSQSSRSSLSDSCRVFGISGLISSIHLLWAKVQPFAVASRVSVGSIALSQLLVGWSEVFFA